jgi:putative peptidoglycan lipid II flippase
LSQKRDAEAMDTQNRGVELALFLTLPATIAFVFASEPIIRGLFQHGHFTAVDSVRCSWALAAFSLGLPSYVLVKVLTPGYYARHDTKTPVRYAVQSVGVNLVGNLILIPLLGRYGYGHVGPPLATALASTLNVWMLYRTLSKRDHFHTDARLRRRVPRLAVASLIMGGMLFFVTPLIDPYLTGSILSRMAGLLALVGAGVAVYGIACFLTGAFRLDDVKLLLKRRAKDA